MTPSPVQLRLRLHDDLLVDNFAGGGGASTAIEAAFRRAVDIAVNHNPEAVAMHAANHPHTRHFCQDVFSIDPQEATGGKRVALAWFSPDCTHFSKAKGGKPRSSKIRDLAWVVIRWAKMPAAVRPRIIMLENVEEFREWGPLLADGRPCQARKGTTFDRWRGQLERLGYEVDCRLLRACDYGAPTIRRRLFLVARCDGKAIRWPEPTHGDPQGEAVRSGRLLPWAAAADSIDWSIPCRSIFDREKELVKATRRRIARGVRRYVLETEEPFVVNDKVSFLAKHYGGGYTGPGHSLAGPCGTITTVDHHALVSAHVMRQFGKSVGSSLNKPLGTVTAGGSGKSGLITSHLVKLRGTCKDGQPVVSPMPTITAGGNHIGEVRATLIKYYGTDQNPRLNSPLHTITTKDRFGLVETDHAASIVTLTEEERYKAWWAARFIEEYDPRPSRDLDRPAYLTTRDGAILIDIGMRMLTPRELFNAQGFPRDYIIDPVINGKPVTKASQVRACGNSVSPPPAIALIRANIAETACRTTAAA